MKSGEYLKVNVLRFVVVVGIICALTATCFCGVVVLGGRFSWSEEKLLTESIKSETINGIEIENIIDEKKRVVASFPKTYNQEVNDSIKSYVETEIQDFEIKKGKNKKAVFYLWFKAYSLDGNVVSFLFNEDELGDRVTVNTMTFNLQTSQQYQIEDLFETENFASVLSSKCEVKCDEFGCFVIDKDKLVIFGSSYLRDCMGPNVVLKVSLLEFNDILAKEFAVDSRKIIRRLNKDKIKDEKIIALTFDDGPYKVLTPRLLDILKEKEVNATFFVLGCMVEKNPELLKRIFAEGHQVGNHTYSHKNLFKLSEDKQREEIKNADSMICDVTGHRPTTFRPPYGNYDEFIKEVVGLPLVLWSIDVEDWKYRNVEVICDKVINSAQNGDIVLLHDIYETTVDSVRNIVDALRDKGFRFVTVDELLLLNR